MNLLEDFVRDVRHGFTRLARTPGFTVIAILTLALGLGATTAIFTVVNKALLRPLPVESPEQIVALNNATKEGRAWASFSYLNYKDLRDRSASSIDLLAYSPTPVSLSHDGVNERVWSYVVSGNYFATLGLKPAVGRLISTSDDVKAGAHPVAVIGYDAWKRRFAGDPNVIGKPVLVNGRQFTVIGVAPPDFLGLEVAFAAEMWFPMMMQSELSPRSRWQDRRGFENLYVDGRLKPGVNQSTALTSLRATALDLEREYPEDDRGRTIVLSSAGLFGVMGKAVMLPFSVVVLIVAGLVLLLVCTNLANLCLARVTHRQREIAMQRALGASRGRIIRQLLTECLILSIAGGVSGLFLAMGLMTAASRFRLPIDIPLSFQFEIDWRVVVFTFAVSVITSLAFGILPAWKSSGFVGTLAVARRSRLRGVLVGAQVSLSFVLMICAGLTLRSLQSAEFVSIGMNPENAVEMGFDVDLQGYNRERGIQFQENLVTQVRAIPGVRAAGVGSVVLPDPHVASARLRIEGQPENSAGSAPRAGLAMVSPGYLEAMAIGLVRGRDFDGTDVQNSRRVAVVNETFMHRFWNGQDALGKRFAFGDASEDWYEIVGIVRDGKYRSLGEEAMPFMFVPIRQRYTGLMKLVARTTGSDTRLREIRSALQTLDPNMPVFDVQTLMDHMRLPLFPARIAALLFGAFGSLALALAAIGVFGVVSFTVSRRTQEIGVRMALGANHRDVLRLIVQQGMRPVLIGLTIGLVVALVLGPLIQIEEILYNVSATDPVSFGGIALLLGGVGLIACYVPARRALSVNPITALRHE